MPVVSRLECQQLATLARLSLDNDEAERLASQLGPILAYLEQLQAVDTTGVPEHLPPARPGSALRPDVAVPPLATAQVLANAPAVRNDQIVVPKFKED
ncbi:MAG: Asp-tRNA(Asn)/Glu-tRNA(Gln) amidotransferase subunit GatC [Deltaproteobacteria bacterium]|nr:Asp-tRNA(Asn)/Glu-tRNA(Gln) amidotransferase subunit GatC [Deltaproteobacteria bacterium]